MYIIRNALRSITRSKGRNILIGIIVLLIAVSACVGLSIRQAAIATRNQALSGMSVTAQISLDRSSMMQGFRGDRENGENFDPSSFKEYVWTDKQSIAGGITDLRLSGICAVLLLYSDRWI